MSENRTVKRIGTTLREELREVVEAGLPQRLQELLQRLKSLERQGRLKPERDQRGGGRQTGPRFL